MRKGDLFWGLILVFFGGMLLLDNLGLLPANVNVWSLVWPVGLIALGVRGILAASDARRGHGEGVDVVTWTSPSTTSTTPMPVNPPVENNTNSTDNDQ